MSTDNDGVVTFRADPDTLAKAIRSAPRPRRRIGRAARADAVVIAGHLMRELPEAEPSSLKAVAEAERIIAERDMLIADLRRAIDEQAEARHDIDLILDGVPGLSQSHDSQAGDVSELAERLKSAEAQNITLREALAGGYLLELADLRAKVADYENAIAWNTSCTACARTLDSSIAEHERADKAEQAAVAMSAALERFAAPGAMTAGERRKAASDALSAAQGDAEVGGHE